MDKEKPVETASDQVFGRALVDIPRLGIRCGEYTRIDAKDARDLADSGQFDPAAIDPAVTE